MLKSTLFHRQKGAGLVELMVGMAIGLIIVAAAASVYITTVRGGAQHRIARCHGHHGCRNPQGGLHLVRCQH